MLPPMEGPLIRTCSAAGGSPTTTRACWPSAALRSHLVEERHLTLIGRSRNAFDELLADRWVILCRSAGCIVFIHGKALRP